MKPVSLTAATVPQVVTVSVTVQPLRATLKSAVITNWIFHGGLHSDVVCISSLKQCSICYYIQHTQSHKMPDQPKPPLKVDQSGCNFHRKLSLYQRMNLYWSCQLEGHIRNFSSGMWGYIS